MSLMLSSLLGGGARGLMAGEEARRQQDRESLSYFATLSELVEKGRMTNAEALQRYKEWTGYEPDRRTVITRTKINDWTDPQRPKPPVPPLIQAPPFPSQPDLSQQMGWMEPKSYPRSPLHEAAGGLRAKKGPVGQEPLAGKWPYNDHLDRQPKTYGPVDTRRVPPLGPWDLSNPEAIRYRDTDPMTQGIMHLPPAGQPDPRNYGIPEGRMQPWPKQPIPFEQRERQSAPPSAPLTTYQPPDPQYEFPRLAPRFETKERTEEINPFTAQPELKILPFTGYGGIAAVNPRTGEHKVLVAPTGKDGKEQKQAPAGVYKTVVVPPNGSLFIIGPDGKPSKANPGDAVQMGDPNQAAAAQKAMEEGKPVWMRLGPGDVLTRNGEVVTTIPGGPSRPYKQPMFISDPKTGKPGWWWVRFDRAGENPKPMAPMTPAEVQKEVVGKDRFKSYPLGTAIVDQGTGKVTGQTPPKPVKPSSGRRSSGRSGGVKWKTFKDANGVIWEYEVGNPSNRHKIGNAGTGRSGRSSGGSKTSKPTTTPPKQTKPTAPQSKPKEKKPWDDLQID